MKKIAFILILITGTALCAPECITMKRPLGTIDYKTPHLVGQDGGCTCPCQKMYAIMRRGKCTQCHHFRTTIPVNTTNFTTPIAALNLRDLIAQHLLARKQKW